MDGDHNPILGVTTCPLPTDPDDAEIFPPTFLATLAENE
jgi:hypothetical protein